MKTIIGITGTTSVGKSAVGVELARILQSEVISADSMQIYKGMDVGTAKITSSEMRGIKHHMIDVVEPNVKFSSFLYQQQASRIIDNLTCTPIVVGGTGFYFDSLIYPPEFGGVDEERRCELKTLYTEQGLTPLLNLLANLDPEAYDNIDINNPKRVLRAIEIAESGAKRLGGKGRSAPPKYGLKLFVLERSRECLYSQIELRVDKMIEFGLVDEVKNLVGKYGVCDTPAFQAIGYKEIISSLRNEICFDEAIDRIKINTKHYAKRQITYFKKMHSVETVNVENKSAKFIAKHIADALNL